MEIDTTRISRQDFIDFFRDDDRLNLLTNDDRLEIFTQILAGSSDITKELLDGLLSDYSVGRLKLVQVSGGYATNTDSRW